MNAVPGNGRRLSDEWFDTNYHTRVPPDSA